MKSLGGVLLGLGVALVIIMWNKASGKAQYMSLWWNINHTEVVFNKNVVEDYATLGQVRAMYPVYADMDDQELFSRLHKRFFLYLSEAQYRHRSLGSGPGLPRPVRATSGDPLKIRGEFLPYPKDDAVMRTIISGDAIDLGLYDFQRIETAAPFRYFALLGGVMGLTGVWLIIWGGGRKKYSHSK